MIFISINIYSSYEADEDMGWYGFCSTQEICVSLAEPAFYNKEIQFARIPAEFVVRFITYQNHVKVIVFPIAAQYLLLISSHS